MPIEIVHDEARSRYEIADDGTVVGVADYVLDGRRAMFTHTHVSHARRGEGLAAKLVQGALDDVRSRGLLVVPACWYVAQFIDDHEEYRDLLADDAG